MSWEWRLSTSKSHVSSGHVWKCVEREQAMRGQSTVKSEANMKPEPQGLSQEPIPI